MANLQQGLYGDFYGSYYDESEYLSKSYQEVNARYIYSFLLDKGWTINAIAAIIGNMEKESTLNPGLWEANNDGFQIGNTSVGYGLTQWTPASKYIDWATQQSLTPSHIDSNLQRILYDFENNIQWYATSSYDFSFREFSKSTQPPSYLAAAFMLNYERPYDQSLENQAARGAIADKWYTFLTGETPISPNLPTTKSNRKKGYNFLLFNRRRRMEQWIKRNF